MSVISKAMIIAAAGAGGETYWVSQSRQPGTNLNVGGLVVRGTEVYVGTQGSSYGTIIQLNAKTGEKNWDFGTKGRKSYDPGYMNSSFYLPSTGPTVDSSGVVYINGYYAGGVTGTAISGQTLQFTKYDRSVSTTTPQWVYTWGFDGYNQSGSWKQGIDSSDYYYTAGSLQDTYYKGYVGKFNSSGTNQWWRRIYNSTYQVYTKGCHITTTDKVIVFGDQTTPSIGYRAPWLIRFDSSGTQEAITTLLHGNGNQVLYSAYPHTDDTILLAYADDVAGNGYFLTHMNMNTFAFVNKVKVLNAFTGGKSGLLLPRTACVDNDGYAYIAFSASGATDTGQYLGKMNLSTSSWEWFCRVYNPTSGQFPEFGSCLVDANGTPYFMMSAKENSVDDLRVWCLKLPPDGSFIGNTYYNMQFTDYSAYQPGFASNSATTTSSYLFTTSVTPDNTSYTTSVTVNASNVTTTKVTTL